MENDNLSPLKLKFHLKFHLMKTKLILPFALKQNFLTLLVLWASWNVQAQTTRYVKPTASGSGDGTSWANASNDFQAMIQASASGDAVWVAAGTYKPTHKPFDAGVEIITGDVRDKTFHLKDGVSIYGGFAGSETAPSQRNIAANETILSGDFNDNDVVMGSGALLDITNNTENAYHVVLASTVAGSGVTIDGFTIRGGYGRYLNGFTVDGNVVDRKLGGGIFIFGGTNTLTHNTFSANASEDGGGIYIKNGTTTLTNNTFSTNFARADLGGGVLISDGTATLTNNTFSANWATYGGGLQLLSCTAVLTNNTFSANAASEGSGMRSYSGTTTLANNRFLANTADAGAAAFMFGNISTLTNNTFSANSAQFGGGIAFNSCAATLTNNTLSVNSALYGGGIYLGYGTYTLTNNTFSANSADFGGGVYTDDGMNTLTNNLFWDNQQTGLTTVQGADYYANGTNDNTFKNNLLQLASSHYPVSSSGTSAIGAAATGNRFAMDPLFVNAASGNFQLQAGSPCINGGNVTAWTATGLTTDAMGNPSPYGLGVDIGAYEYQGAAALPIEMVSFTAKPTEYGNQLVWQTASETQNVGFEIEKSQDGRIFERIGFVSGNGTTHLRQTYNFLDPNVAKSVTYYRLKQVNSDGTFEYSKIISVETTGTVAVQIRPTKVIDVLTVSGATEYQIFNAAGQWMLQSLENQLNVSHLPSGVYLLRTQSETLKFVKL